MPSAKLLLRIWKYLENAIFIFVFFYTSYYLVTGFGEYVWKTIQGKGFIETFSKHLSDKEYYNCVLAVVLSFVSFFYLSEIVLLFIEVIKREKNTQWNYGKWKIIFNEVVKRYKLTFLANYFGEVLGKIILLDIFWRVQPFFQPLSLFTTNFAWYSWIYAYFVWELSTWVWHYGAHRIRLFWCLHSPHHAPEELNMTSAWVHFFAEGFYTSAVQLIILMALGVQPKMLLVIMAIEVSWGTFIHAGERSFKKGRLGFLHHFIITPSHHRVHHAKNPLYMDTNFCTFLPFWDWLFGTLQPQRDEVKLEYGITRKIETGNFMDFYFGDFFLLIKDVKNAKGFKNKMLYLIKPPGWSPGNIEHTASTVRGNFLKENPALGMTSKDLIFGKNLNVLKHINKPLSTTDK
jgi:sterol desaturase/sphingolipid hydroxylase (fatty acid hydroxylase superfamily)